MSEIGRFMRDLVRGVIHLLAYIPRGIAHWLRNGSL